MIAEQPALVKFVKVCGLFCLLSFLCAATVVKADDLQGQHSDGLGHPQGSWVSGNLQNWRELDYIPCRIKIEGGATSSKTVSVEFPHSANGTPGFQNLTSFVPSSNVQILSGPTLTMAGETWKYTLNVKVLNNQPATVEFFARMRAGAHRFTGSSLKLYYPPLQIHKPDPGPGIPDLMVNKIGPDSAGPGDLITYTIFYTNKLSAANAATGVQLTDVLPTSVTYVPGSASNGGEMVGDSIVWDLPNLPVGASGSVTYQAIVNSNVVSGSTFQNSVEILSAEDDFNYADNTSFVVTVVAFNRAPVANSDSYTVAEDGVLNIGVPGILANDTDADNDALSAKLVSGPLHGTLTLNSNGSFTYAPASNFHGTDSFNYRANDGANDSGVATVTITITSENDAPVANNDAYTVAEGGTLSPNVASGVLANDTDAETNALTAILVSGPSNGTVTLNADGSFTYVHNGSETKSDSFTYKANDGLLDSGVARVTITITSENDAPVADNDAYTVAEGGTLSPNAVAGVLANDTDAETNALTAILVSGPNSGTVTLNADGSFTYIHNGSETKTDSFTYKANDGLLDSGVATVTITITSENDAPVANNDAYTVAEGGTLSPNAVAGVLANDTDAETNALTAILVSQPSNGTVTLNADGSFTYVHNGSETKSDSFTYKANDELLDSGVATVAITITSENDVPVANNDAYTVAEGGTLNPNVATGVLANDTDAETNALTATLVSGPASGTVTLNADGSFTYVHNGSETKTDSFTYKANDGLLDSGVATVTITITSENDAPVANNDAYTVAEGGTLSPNVVAGVLANDTDAETNALTAILVSGPASGTVTLNADGSFTYIHNGSETKTDSFTYKANDGLLDSGVATVTITITSENDAPVANNDAYTVAEGGTLNPNAVAGVLANDTDAETNALTAILVSQPSSGTVTLNADGSFTYVHNGSETKSDSFTYKANDGLLDSGIATVTITITSENDAPVANNDAYTVAEGGTLSPDAVAGVLANDTDAETNALTAILVSGPASGTVTLNADGSFTYVHNGSETKSDSFTYKANDGLLDSGVATVTITITSENDAPVANNDAYTVAEGGTLNPNAVAGVLANDTDAETNTLTAILVSGPAGGTVTLNADGSFTYIHNGSETKTDSFTYKANDGSLDSGVATVTITITSENDAPVANNDAYTVAEGGTLNPNVTSGVLANDTDAETNTLTAILVSQPSNGTVTLNADGSFTYVHNGSETKSDSFTYKANDGLLDSGVATVTITITSENDAPVANNDAYTVAEGGTLNPNVASGVLANDTDAETNALTAILVSGPSSGTVTLNVDGSFTYVHNGSEAKSDSFTYKANDGLLDSGVATVAITITSENDAPIANNDAYTVAEGGTLNPNIASGVLANDTDAETNALTAILVSGPNSGTVTLNADGSFTYVHNGSETKSDSFTYKANDGLLDSGVATVTITITSQNDAPVANNDAYTVAEGGTLNPNVTSGVLANDTDAETNALTAILVSQPSNGTVTLNADGSFTYVHNGSETKSDSFTYKANDGLLDSGVATVTITITSENDAPVANNDAYTVAEGGTLNPNVASGVLANDTDAETNALTAILVSGPASGTVTLNADGSFTYVHNGSEAKSDSFTYKANDGLLDSGVATVTITITSENDAPVANNDAYTVAEGGTLNPNAVAGVLANDTDAETNALTAILVSGPTSGTVTLNADGSFTYVHNGSETKTDSFTYKANDGLLDSGVATVTITITSENDAPVANNDAYEVNEDTQLTISAAGVLLNDTDAETNHLNAVLVSATTNGTVTLTGDGAFIYQPKSDFHGIDSFTYQATDGAAISGVAKVNLLIRSVNDAPGFSAGPDQLVVRNSSARTIPNWATNIKPGPANEQEQTVAFHVSNDNPALFLQQPSISPDGTLAFAPAFNAYGRASVTVTLQDNGGTANGGVDSSALQTFSIIVNSPPTVTLASPTNGSTFIWGQNITLIADAMDPDGSVTNVQFFEGTNKLGDDPDAPFFQVLTNMQPGIYQFTATATDDLGLSATSSAVTITVLGSLPFTQAGPMSLNPQTGLIEQHLLVQNPTPLTLSAARVLVFGLTAPARVYNLSGTNENGIPFVQYNRPILPGAQVEMLIEYYVPSRIPPKTTLVMEVVPALPGGDATGVPQKINRALRFTGGTFLLEFTTLTNRFYAIQYSSDLVNWQTVSPNIKGNGSKVQWIDNGAPKTESLPGDSGQRFYRLILLP